MKDLHAQLAFIQELDKLKSVYRKALIKCDNNRYENSAEHSWHVALMAQVLAPYVEADVDINRAVTMLLLHDIVEIDAGDTFAFDTHDNLSQQAEKELKAAERIFGLLPSTQGEHFLSTWLEFEEAKTPDAIFAKSMDRVLPLIQNMQNDGGSWAQNKVRKQQVLNRNKHLAQCAPKLWLFVQQQVDLATQNGWLIDND